MAKSKSPKKERTRQQLWQDAKRAAGLCINCGVEPLLTKNHGAKCARKIREAARKRNGAKKRYKAAKSYQEPAAAPSRRCSSVRA